LHVTSGLVINGIAASASAPSNIGDTQEADRLVDGFQAGTVVRVPMSILGIQRLPHHIGDGIQFAHLVHEAITERSLRLRHGKVNLAGFLVCSPGTKTGSHETLWLHGPLLLLGASGQA
jgi:hypothetical protein